MKDAYLLMKGRGLVESDESERSCRFETSETVPWADDE